MDTAKTAAKTVKEEVEKAWNELSADDPEECPVERENEEEEVPVEETVEELEKHEADDVPTIKVENPNKPE